jgi:hypothetical protein
VPAVDRPFDGDNGKQVIRDTCRWPPSGAGNGPISCTKNPVRLGKCTETAPLGFSDRLLVPTPSPYAYQKASWLVRAVSGLLIRGMSIDILAQIGFVVLVALASKNAILIVEFAKQAEDAGETVRDAAVQAAQTRLRPILMTSLAFILGVVPLAVATGAGAEMRQSLGTAVFFGMLGVTLFGLMFTPTFYTVVRRIAGRPAATVRKASKRVDAVLVNQEEGTAL